MNAPTNAVAALPKPAAEWHRLAMPLGLGLLLLGAVFYRETAAAVQTWNTSTAYNHCFLIIPITLYLLWDRRVELAGIPARLTPMLLLFGLPLGCVWLTAERLGIMEGRQLAALSFAELLFLAMLGKRLWWAMSGPLLYLYFLVPFGEFLTPKLQDTTTWFIRQGLQVVGVPAYIDGYVIEIPQGTFFVAEACAGLRFLIASIAFGCLYALLIYRSPLRRGVFILASIVVPVIANGLRGVGIVYLGHLLGSAEAAAADHVIYGWVFFAAVTLLLIALGLPFRQDENSPRSPAPADEPHAARTAAPWRMVAVATAMAVVAAITPAVADLLSPRTAGATTAAASIQAGPDCAISPAVPQADASGVRRQRIVCHDVAIDLAWEAFMPRITAAPLMAERRRLVLRAATEGLSESWLDNVGGKPSAWRMMRSSDPAFMIAVAVWVDGQPTRPGLPMRMRMAMNSLFGADFVPVVATVTPAVDWSALTANGRKAAEASLPAFLLSHPDLGQDIGRLPATR